MKRVFRTLVIFAAVLFFSGCDHIVEATDDSLHSAYFYFYNYTNQEFYAKLTPTDFRGKQKFRIQKSGYIPIKTDDEKITEPSFSFEWIPGDFYINLTQNKSEEHTADLQFFNHRKELPIVDCTYFRGVPSAQDYFVHFYVVECKYKKTLSSDEMNSCIEKITDNDELALFCEFYNYNPEAPQDEYNFSFYYVKRNGVYLETPIEIKNYIREIEAIITKYDLPTRESVCYLFNEAFVGDLDYELRNPENEKYRKDDLDDSDDDLDY